VACPVKKQPLSGRQYDAMADEYAADNAESPMNAYYERPATISLIGEVEGLDVLEAGCGSGLLTAWLVDHGAKVTAFDASTEMVRMARSRVGDRAMISVADLSEPLSFARDSSF
jgi:2-polyprenyl-3-methyl-5-hydroxy-6-metoxy-1,4-benzoquinol methylase